jgi:hypothetical protein
MSGRVDVASLDVIDGDDMMHWRGDRVRAAIDGRNSTVLAELDASFAVIGDVQF